MKIFKEAWKCKSAKGAKTWLEREAKRKTPEYSISGAKFLIRMNLAVLASKYGSYTEKRIKKLFGVTNPLFGKERDEFSD